MPQAATAGYAPAQWALGLNYRLGKDLPKDLDKAREWFEKSAAQGFSRADGELVRMNRTAPSP
jgi:TPR repeat protein